MSYNHNSWETERGEVYMPKGNFLVDQFKSDMQSCSFKYCVICGYSYHCSSDCPILNPSLSWQEQDQLYSSWENQTSLYDDCSDHVSEPCFEEDPDIKRMLEKLLKQSEEALEAQKHTLDNMCAHTKIPETRIAQHDCLFEFETEKLELEKSPCDHDCFEIEPYVNINKSHSDFDDFDIDLSDNLFEEKVEKIEIENPSFDDNSDFDVVSFMVKSDELDKGLKIIDIDEHHYDFGDIFEINDKSLVVDIDSIEYIDKSHPNFSYDSDFDSSDDELFVGRHEEIDFVKSHLDLNDDFEIEKLFDDEHEEVEKDLNVTNTDESHSDVLPLSFVESFDEFEKLIFEEPNERPIHYYDDPMLDYFDQSPMAIEDLNLKKGLMILLSDKHRKIIEYPLSEIESFDFDSYMFKKATLIVIYMIFWIFGLVAKIFGKKKRKKLHALYFGTDSPASP